MNSVIMDNAVIGESSIVAALTFVKANVVIPPRSLVMGIPGKVVRTLTDQEVAWKSEGTAAYQMLTQRSMASLKAVEPLSEVEPDRKCVPHTALDPLYETKLKFSG